MNYIVIDFEFNQTYKEKDYKQEIIEIGAYKLNEQFEIVDKFHSFVKPSIINRLDKIVQKITGITIEELNTAQIFPEIMNEFLKWIGDDFIFCVYGNEDIKWFNRNCQWHNIELEKITKYINIFKLLKKTVNQELSLKKALYYFNLPVDGQDHRALDDAYNSVRVLQEIKEEV